LSFEAAKNFLYGLEKFGMKMDLQNIERLMEFAGNPHERLRIIHVAGTNGKGSTCAMVSSILTSGGYMVGLYTSPHIVSFTERIKINGEPISDDEVEKLTNFFRQEILKLRATFFEATTAMMFKYFADRKVDFAVIETGLGGRLDATNIVNPLISIITGISFDHTEILGDTLEKIAFEKAGIIKPNKPAVVNVKFQSLKKVFRDVGLDKGSEVFFVDESSGYSNAKMGIDSSIFDASVYGIPRTDFLVDYPRLSVKLVGRHQIQNSLTALVAMQILSNAASDGTEVTLQINRNAIYAGFERILKNTQHRGRFEVVSRVPLVIMDVAHNPDGINAVIESLSVLDGTGPLENLPRGTLKERKGVLLFAAMRDKDTRSMLNSLRERFGTVILSGLRNDRSMNLEELKNLSDNIKLDARIFADSSDALRAALTQTDESGYLLITGSHYLVGEVMAYVTELSGSDGTHRQIRELDVKSCAAR